MKCRKTPYVLQYYVPNKEIKSEEYAHHMLFMYYSFKDEKDYSVAILPRMQVNFQNPG